ncbi:glycosyltransferase [Campylobacter suis]|uniref:UDP-Gal:alpha-D-GlcNAc-diphosphoundecaprenol beta-1,3-galactosyltransferase n=1 Tax=Campylobacter suis TaxID=2790657 RepID=A0ABM8Q387_9BACT|nr:glycosyltransferase [Campylobacter suis]CAD7287292.1 UDP-Gal:alpha-D-GlcNAc-diphosphoundecaprenol beta-1,3-galactosyltransferase [Campylobacter suis]
MNFSVLMSVYFKENAEFLNRAMVSIWDEQILKPNQIVLVEDGKLTDELYDVITKWKNKLGEVLAIKTLKKNMGLGDALNKGLDECKYELVARMDSDDISAPSRFEKQISIFKNNLDIDICGSWISEFDSDENEILSYRKLPQTHDEIVKFAKIRSPINHPSVMFKKSAVLSAGSYQKMIFLEDYYLWVRMIMNGAKFYNIQEALVNMRAGTSQLSRRSGLRYAKYEFALLKAMKNLGFLSSFEFIKMAIIKIPLRLMPKSILKNVYKLLRS